MEPLIEIAPEKWRELRDLFRNDWPHGAPIYCMLDLLMAYPGLIQDSDVHIYCPEGILANGIVAIYCMNGHTEVIIQPIDKNISNIEAALLTTKFIDWNGNVIVPFANATAIECLERTKKELGINLVYNNQTKAYIHYLNKSSASFDEMVIPADTFIGMLRPEHIDIVDKSWTYYNKHSRKTFEILMKHDLAYVLYIKNGANYEDKEIEVLAKKYSSDQNTTEEAMPEKHKCVLELEQRRTAEHIVNFDDKNTSNFKIDSNIPVAWLSVNEQGSLSHLFCSQEHRNKGYGEAITRYVCNKLLSNGLSVIAYTIEDNIKPRKLFGKLGFQELGHVFWVIVNKQSKN